LALAAALLLEGCSGPSPPSSDRGRPGGTAVREADGNSPGSRSGALHGATGSGDSTFARASAAGTEAGDAMRWLAEPGHDGDPNARMQALESWSRQPGASLDPFTHALVDPDESVRARAQELFEQALASR
jgi:hypothetical protein